ncbi:MAG: hydrogenase iron-sulfur subunit [Chloroflexota bacterium]|nr:hydrogenase iron-sulfur subunit [Chloroflexota bacterium]
MNSYNPKIVVFACNWSGIAGSSELKANPSLQVIDTMCSGRVDPSFVLQAFSSGADGVMIIGCPPGDCHFISGNYKTQRIVMLLRSTLSQFGIEPERLKLVWGSTPEAVGEFADRVAGLGALSRSTAGVN